MGTARFTEHFDSLGAYPLAQQVGGPVRWKSFAGQTDLPMQIVDLIEDTPPMVHRNQMLNGCTVDDEMWYHALMTRAHHESEVRLDLQNQHLEEWVLYQLIHRGVIDQDDNWDKVFRPATRAMRYSASLADLLWVKINQECERVSTSLSGIIVCRLTRPFGVFHT